jgi:iron complex outermembrane receptor protein
MKRSFGRLRATSLSSYLLNYWEKIPSASGFQTIKHEGKVVGEPERAFPRFKSNLVLAWFYEQVELALTTRYIHSVTEQCRELSDFPGTCSDPDRVDDTRSTNELDITVYNDVQVMWTPAFDQNLMFTAGVNNLFNVDPPVCFSCALNGFNGATYDVPGVFGYLSAGYHMQ